MRRRHHHVPYFFRLQRRLFLSFGVTIVVTVALVMGLSHFFSQDSWNQETQRLQRWVGGEFSRVWDQPVERDALAQRIATELDARIELRDAQGALLLRVGEECRWSMAAPIVRGGVQLGVLRGCTERMQPRPWRIALPLLVIALALWWTAGRLSARILRPLGMVVRLAEDLGAGKLDARARSDCFRNGEERIVAESLNHMAERIERQIADQRELLSVVSHEMRTPLGHMRLITEMARGGSLDEKALGELDKEIAEIDELVGDLLANSRLQFATLARQKLDGADLAKRALERAGLPVELLAVEGVVALEGDATLLGRALANLLENARRHAAGATRLTVAKEGSQVIFAAEDAGPGFPAGEEATAFVGSQRRAQSPHGTLGLGLNLVQRIARAHGGEAFARNRAEGGARVGFRIAASG